MTDPTADEKTHTYEAIAAHQPLVDFVIQRFQLPSIDQIVFNGMDDPFLEKDGDLSSRLEFNTRNIFQLTFPDDSGYWLTQFKGYQPEAFAGVMPRRQFMDDPRCEANYRILLGFQIAIELAAEMRSLDLQAAIDMRIRLHGCQQLLDYAGLAIFPIDGPAKVVEALPVALSATFLQSYQ